MKYYFEPEGWSQVMALPRRIVDEYIRLTGKAQLRVILYLLCHIGEDIPDGALSDALALHPDEVSQALEFWQEAGILIERPDAAGTSAAVQPPSSADVEAIPAAAQTREPPRPRTLTRSPMNDPAVVAARIRESAALRTLIEEAELLLGKNLRAWEADILINLHDADEMPADVIMMVLHYAIARGKTSIRYIEKTAQSWMEQGVDTIEKAEQKIRMIQAAAGAWSRVSSLFHIEGRKPSTREEEYVLRWLEEWHMPDELLLLAYDRCADATGKMNFAYMNKILQKWAESGFTTANQVETGERSPARETAEKRPNKKQKSSYDLKIFEQMLLEGGGLSDKKAGGREDEQ